MDLGGDQARGRYRHGHRHRSHRHSRTRRSRPPGPPSTGPRTCAASARGGDRLRGRGKGNDVNARGVRGRSWGRWGLGPPPHRRRRPWLGLRRRWRRAGGRCESMSERTAEGCGGANCDCCGLDPYVGFEGFGGVVAGQAETCGNRHYCGGARESSVE